MTGIGEDDVPDHPDLDAGSSHLKSFASHVDEEPLVASLLLVAMPGAPKDFVMFLRLCNPIHPRSAFKAIRES